MLNSKDEKIDALIQLDCDPPDNLPPEPLTEGQLRDLAEHEAAVRALGGMPQGKKYAQQTPGNVLGGLMSSQTRTDGLKGNKFSRAAGHWRQS